MIKGSTPTYTFTIPFDTTLILKARVSFGQDNKEIVCKKESECVYSGNTISVELTQEETLKFNHQRQMQIQLKIKSHDNKVVLSDTITTDVEIALCNEVL